MKQLFYCIDVLELPITVLDFLDYSDDLAMDLRKFKKMVAKQRNALAKKYHSDVSEGNEDRMKEINNVVDFVNGLRMMPVRRRPVFRYDFGMNTATTSDVTFTYHWSA